MHLPALLAMLMAAHEPDPHPQLVVVGLVDLAIGSAREHPCDLAELGAPLVDLVRS